MAGGYKKFVNVGNESTIDMNVYYCNLNVSKQTGSEASKNAVIIKRV